MDTYNFDTALLRLKEIIESLESGDADLEMSMKLYEEGVHLVAFCNKSLENAKQKVIELSEIAGGEENE